MFGLPMAKHYIIKKTYLLLLSRSTNIAPIPCDLSMYCPKTHIHPFRQPYGNNFMCILLRAKHSSKLSKTYVIGTSTIPEENMKMPNPSEIHHPSTNCLCVFEVYT